MTVPIGNTSYLAYAEAYLIKEEISRAAASFEETDLMALVCRQQMQKAKEQLLARIDSMLQMGSSAAELRQASQAGLLQLKSLQHGLASKTAEAGHKAAALSNKILGIENSIQAAGFSLENFSYPIKKERETNNWSAKVLGTHHLAADKQFSTPDGSIEPISSFLLSTPSEVVSQIGKKVVKMVCESHPHIQNLCKDVQEMLPTQAKRPTALVLTANSDHNGAFDLSVFSRGINVLVQTQVFKEIERRYDTSYVRISSVDDMCKAIDVKKAQGMSIDLLILRGHGSRFSMELDGQEKFFIGYPLPSDACLQNLAPEAKIVLNSCSTGKGKDDGLNLANYIALYAPEDAHIFAPVEDSTHFTLSENPFDIRFVCLPEGAPLSIFSLTSENMTYEIDNSTRNKPIYIECSEFESFNSIVD